MVQVGISGISLIIQVCAFLCALPLKDYLSRRFWTFIVLLTVFEVIRRILTLASVAGLVQRDYYEVVSVAIGFLISATLLLVVGRLRSHAKRSKALARATLELGDKHNAQQSLAYRLALYFIEKDHAKDHR